MQTINIFDILNYTVNQYKSARFSNDKDLLEIALNNIDWSITKPDMREDTVDNYIAKDPYCWMVIPNFAELDENNVEEIAVDYGDGMVVISPLIH
jgi:hypothetical protein